MNEVVTRREWGARYGTGDLDPGPERRVVIHHSYRPVLQPTATQAEEIAAWKGIEKYHVETNGWDGIGYNFGVAPSGRIYEGRGWKFRGAHAGPVNGESIGICLLIDGTVTEPTPQSIASVRRLIQIGLDLGEVDPRYQVSGHRDHMDRTCPGDKVYVRLQSFRHNAERDAPNQPPTGSQVYSHYFSSNLTLVQFLSDTNWYFTVNRSPLRHGIVKSQSPWSVMESPR